QLGAFGQPGNADALWSRVKGRPELAGKPRLNVKAGTVTRLQAGGFSTEGEARAACGKLKAAGFDCSVVAG
ncbi:MAG: SPOR domain-containing protein, partial [Sphingomonadales bacterium]|nr:SPOR domain-containing protein [Sphingomonadales bacterium]